MAKITEKMKQYKKEWAKKHIEEKRIKNRIWRELNPEKHRKCSRDWYYKNSEYSKKKSALWIKNNPEKKRFINKSNLIKSRTGEGLGYKFIQSIYENNIKKHGTLTCELCNSPIEFGRDCLDHKIPLVRGGNNSLENLHVVHFSCNAKKHIKTVEEFLNGPANSR